MVVGAGIVKTSRSHHEETNANAIDVITRMTDVACMLQLRCLRVGGRLPFFFRRRRRRALFPLILPTSWRCWPGNFCQRNTPD